MRLGNNECADQAGPIFKSHIPARQHKADKGRVASETKIAVDNEDTLAPAARKRERPRGVHHDPLPLAGRDAGGTAIGLSPRVWSGRATPGAVARRE